MEFIALNPAVEVHGSAILATIAGMEADIQPLMAQHGIHSFVVDAWYPQQAWLDVLKAIHDGYGVSASMLDLVSVGMRIPDNAQWPPDVKAVEDALKSIDIAYRMNHRGGEIGHYAAEVISTFHIRVTCDNPYPSDFDYGIIFRTTQKFITPGTPFLVKRAASPSRQKGDDRCIYDVTWGK